MNLTKEDVFYVVPDFPKPGINFLDIQKVFHNNLLVQLVADLVFSCHSDDFDVIVVPDSRGFLLGPSLSIYWTKPVVFVRKPGKLPPPVKQVSYDTEYSSDTLEMSSNFSLEGKRVLIVDDILATGGTLKAIKKLVESSGGVVAGGLFLASVGLFKEDPGFPITIVYK